MNATSTREVGARLREARRHLGLTQLEVATAAGLQRGWLAQLEAGRGNPTLSSLLAVLSVLGLKLELSDGLPLRDSPPTERVQPPVDLDHLLARYRPER